MKEECGAATYRGSAKCYNDYKTCRWHKGWRGARATLSTAVPARPETNTVNHPAHYNVGKIEAITVIEDWTEGWPKGVAFHLGNAIKYIARAGKKGPIAEDLKKARWYIDRALSVTETLGDEGR